MMWDHSQHLRAAQAQIPVQRLLLPADGLRVRRGRDRPADLVEGRRLGRFTTLWELKRLDLSVEAYVLRSEYAPLFTKEERGVARARLKEYGYPI